MATEDIVDVKVDLAKVITTVDNHEVRLNEVEKTLKENTELIVAINGLTTEVKYMREDLNKVTQRVDAIDSKDAETWGKFKWAILVAVIGIVVTFIASSIGLK